MRVLLHLTLASFHIFQLMQKPTAAPIEEAPWQQRRLTHGKLFFFATPCTGYYGLAGLFWSQKRSSRQVDLLMRKNKTGLTAHHFMSAPGDSLSDLFPIYFVCFAAEAPSKCISWSLPTCLFFPLTPLWPVTDTSVQSINLTLPKSKTAPFFSPPQSDTQMASCARLRGHHTKWDKHLAVGKEKLEVESICSAAWPTLIPCHRVTTATRRKWNSGCI